MPESRRCPECGTELPAGVSAEMCPKCLMAAALEDSSSAAGQAPPDENQIDETIDSDGALNSPTLPPSAQITDAVIRDDAATLPPNGQIGDAPPVGTKIRYFGDYELLDEIARGGMGVVHKARQVKLNRIVALKMILTGQLASEQDVQRFYTEAEAAANLDHPGIVPIYEVGEHEGQHFFSMGFVDGESLADRLKDGPLPPREAAGLTQRIAEAVAYAHDKGVIHRDLKPANVLLASGGREPADTSHPSGDLRPPLTHRRPPLAEITPKITDFGLAKKLEGDSNLTGTGQILGTPSYMPPEQAAGKIDEIGPAADVYSLGAILYALLIGRPPFQAATLMDTLKQVIDQEPVSPRQLDPAVSRDLATICLKCLEKSPARRYRSANQLVDELGRLLRGEPILARPVGRPERGWRWCRRKPIAAALIAIVAAVFLLGLPAMTALYFRSETHRTAAVTASVQAENAKRTALQEKAAAEASEREAAEARQTADAARQDAELRLGQLLRTNGSQRMKDEDWHGAAVWFAEALKNETGDPKRQQLDERRLTMVMKQGMRPVRTFRPEDNRRIHQTAISPDGRRVAVADDWDFYGVTTWDVQTGAACRCTGDEPDIKVTQARPLQLKFSDDGRLLVVVYPAYSATGETCRSLAQVLDAETGQPTKLRLRSAREIVQVAFSPDNRFVAFAFRGNPNNGAVRNNQIGSDEGYVQWFHSEEGYVQWWNARTGESSEFVVGTAVASFGAPRTTSVAFSPDANRVFISGEFGDSETGGRCWDVVAGESCVAFESFKIARQPRQIVFTSDGSQIALSRYGRCSVAVADARTGQLKRWVPDPPRDVESSNRSAKIGDDGRWAVTADWGESHQERDTTLQGWDLQTGQPLGKPFTIDGRANFHLDSFKIELHPDGMHVAVAADKQSDHAIVRVWNVATGQPASAKLLVAESVQRVEFTPDGYSLIVTSHNPLRGVRSPPQMWDWREPTPTARRLLFPLFSISGDFRRVATAVPASDEHQRPSIRISDTLTGKTLATCDFTAPRSLVLDSDGSHLAITGSIEDEVADTAVSRDSVLVWDVAAGAPVSPPLTFEKRTVGRVMFDPSGEFLIVERRTTTPPPEPEWSIGRSGFFEFGEQRHSAESAEQEWLIESWYVRDGSRGPLQIKSTASNKREHVSFSPSGRQCAVFEEKGATRCSVWDVVNGTRIGSWSVSSEAALTDTGWLVADFGDDVLAVNTRLPSAQSLQQVHLPSAVPNLPGLFDPASLKSRQFGATVSQVIAARHGSRVAVATNELTVQIWNIESGAISKTIKLDDDPRAMAFSADGQMLATSTSRRIVQLWETSTGLPISPPLKHSVSYPRIGFTPDMDHLVLVPPVVYMSETAAHVYTWNIEAVQRPTDQWRHLTQQISQRGISTSGELVFEEVESEGSPSVWDDTSQLENSAVWYHHQAATALDLERWTTAIYHLNKVIAAGADDAETHLWRGQCRLALARENRSTDDASAAIEDFEKALELSGEFGMVALDLAEAHEQLGQWDEAAALYQRLGRNIPKSDPREADSLADFHVPARLLSKARSLSEQENFQVSLTYYRIAKSILVEKKPLPLYPPTCSELAALLALTERWQELVDLYRELADEEVLTDESDTLGAGVAYLMSEDVQGYARYCDRLIQAVQHEPEDEGTERESKAEYSRELVMTCVLSPAGLQVEQLVALAKQALAQSPDEANAPLGAILVRAGRIDNAIKYLRPAFEADRDDAFAVGFLAMAEHGAGNAAQAVSLLNQMEQLVAKERDHLEQHKTTPETFAAAWPYYWQSHLLLREARQVVQDHD